MDPRLLVAARIGNVDLLKTIAEEDADLPLGATPFCNTALHIAVTFKHQDFVEEICRRKPALLGERNVNDETPLHVAAILGSHRAVVFFLVRAGTPDVERGSVEALLRAVDRYGNNALHAALLNGHAKVAQKLASADPGLGASINREEESPLYLAAMRGFLEIVRLLLECDRSDHRGPRKQTALHAAVIEGHREIGRALLEKRTDIGKEKDDEGRTPLHYAVTWGDLEMVRLLLKHDSSAAYVADGYGRSPVHLCAREGHVAVFFELFICCPDAFDAVDAEGRNALHIAIERENALALCLAMTPGFDRLLKRENLLAFYLLAMPAFDRLLNQRDKEGKTPLHIAVERHHPLIVQQLLQFKRVDTCVTDQQGLTAAQSFYMDKEPHPSLQWHLSHYFLRDLWAKDDARKLNFVKKNLDRIEGSGQRKMLDAHCRNLSVVATLMATVTFAAVFTIPGGYVSEDGPEQGLAVLSRKAAIKVFLISDTISTCCSLSAAYLYSTALKLEEDQWRYPKYGGALVFFAFLGMIIAFATGVYAVVAPHCLWLGILICFLCCSTPFLAVDMNKLSICLLYRKIKVISRRANKLLATINQGMGSE